MAEQDHARAAASHQGRLALKLPVRPRYADLRAGPAVQSRLFAAINTAGSRAEAAANPQVPQRRRPLVKEPRPFEAPVSCLPLRAGQHRPVWNGHGNTLHFSDCCGSESLIQCFLMVA
jgi:hypothetical protein